MGNSTRRIKANGGPVDGKTFDVPETSATFTHHAAPGGHYKVNAKTATWVADKTPAKASS